MGCDIHLYKEKFIDGKWIAADEWVKSEYDDEPNALEVPFEKRFTDRNYELFGVLSKGVRTDHEFAFAPRGIPFNACKEVADEAQGWGCDGHSHSYLYLHELKEMAKFLDTTTTRIGGMKNKEELKALQESIASGLPNWDLLFPYCKWASDSANYERFELDVPASFYMGDAIKRIISSFDGIDGENHRIVFFFDN
jgi:hypothetical protein